MNKILIYIAALVICIFIIVLGIQYYQYLHDYHAAGSHAKAIGDMLMTSFSSASSIGTFCIAWSALAKVPDFLLQRKLAAIDNFDNTLQKLIDDIGLNTSNVRRFYFSFIKDYKNDSVINYDVTLTDFQMLQENCFALSRRISLVIDQFKSILNKKMSFVDDKHLIRVMLDSYYSSLSHISTMSYKENIKDFNDNIEKTYEKYEYMHHKGLEIYGKIRSIGLENILNRE